MISIITSSGSRNKFEGSDMVGMRMGTISGIVATQFESLEILQAFALSE